MTDEETMLGLLDEAYGLLSNYEYKWRDAYAWQVKVNKFRTSVKERRIREGLHSVLSADDGPCSRSELEAVKVLEREGILKADTE